MDLHWWLCECSIWETPRPMSAFPQLRWGWGQCQQYCYLWAHTTGDSWHHQPHTWIDSSCWRILSNSSPSMRAPISPTSYCSSDMNLGLLLQKLRSRPCPWQGSDNERAKTRPCLLSSAGYSHHNTSLPTKRVVASTYWGKRWQAPILKTAFAPKILNPCRLHRNSPA